MILMILEAFSQYLKHHNPPAVSLTPGVSPVASRRVLEAWLRRYLRNQVTVTDIASYQLCRSIQTEFTLVAWQGQHWISATSTSGQRLWAALQHYADSYDQWQFARWMHTTHASDFSNTPGR